MDDTITTIYCLCDDFLNAVHHRDDPQVGLSTAEVMTIPLVAAAFFGGNIDKTRLFLNEYGYVPKTISKSRLTTAAPARYKARTLADTVRAVGRSLQAAQS